MLIVNRVHFDKCKKVWMWECIQRKLSDISCLVWHGFLKKLSAVFINSVKRRYLLFTLLNDNQWITLLSPPYATSCIIPLPQVQIWTSCLRRAWSSSRIHSSHKLSVSLLVKVLLLVVLILFGVNVKMF